MAIVEVDKVSKRFWMHQDRPRSFQDLALTLFRRGRRQAREEFWALRDVTFSVQPGEAVALIGENGSGKSTCFKLLTRIIEPTSGTISVKGRVSALLELGAGFHPELTGRENVFLNCAILGMPRREVQKRFDSIVGFAEMERFIDVPVKFYSSGMYVRLAFATAINVDAEVLVFDEVLAVGDQSFQARCIERINELKNTGITILFVSHDLDAVRSLCPRAIWLDGGKLCADGPTESVATQYIQHLHLKSAAQSS